MEYKDKITKLLEKNLDGNFFKIWKFFDDNLPDCMHLPTSSTGKYHKRKDGKVSTTSEHTYNMLYAATKIMRLFNYKKNSSESNALLLAIALHDRVKYGVKEPLLEHTTNQHDQLMADIIRKNKDEIEAIIGSNSYEILEESIRYHSGIWSSNLKSNPNSFFDKRKEAFFVHILDMLDTANLLKIEEE